MKKFYVRSQSNPLILQVPHVSQVGGLVINYFKAISVGSTILPVVNIHSNTTLEKEDKKSFSLEPIFTTDESELVNFIDDSESTVMESRVYKLQLESGSSFSITFLDIDTLSDLNFSHPYIMIYSFI